MHQLTRRPFPAGWTTVGVWLTLVLLAAGCGEQPATPEAEIRALIDRASSAAEGGDVSGVADALHPDYRDMRGNDRDAVLGILRLRILRQGSTLVIPDIERIEVFGDDAASVVMRLRFAEADMARLSLDAGVREVELDLVRDEDWRVISARWSRAGTAPR